VEIHREFGSDVISRNRSSMPRPLRLRTDRESSLLNEKKHSVTYPGSDPLIINY
jgi:hypothetical protein